MQIQVEITEDMKKRAYVKALEMGQLRNSITKGDGNICGFLGEEIVNSVLCGTIENTWDYDLKHGGFTYDIKTKRCTSEPKDYYECSIAAYNTKQKCDRYIFVRIEWIKGKATRAWILGYIDKEEYLKRSRKLIKGTIDGDNGFVVKADCHNLVIRELKDLKELGMSEE